MTLVLLHALPMDGSMWSPAWGELDDVVAPSLYGLGDSIEAWAAAVLDLAGPGPLTVVGNSVGGSCAIEVALLAPQRVERLVLIGAKAGHRPEPGFRDEAMRFLAEEGMAAGWDRYWAPLLAPDASADVVAHARGIALAQDVDDVIRGTKVFHGRPDRSSMVERITAPVIVVRGEHDPLRRSHESAAPEFPRARVQVVSGAGHYVPIERPAELAALVRDAGGG